MKKILLISIVISMFSVVATNYVDAKIRNATLSIIYNQSTSQSDIKRIEKELGKEFETVQPFALRKKTNFFLNYFITDENFIQYEVTRRGESQELQEDTVVSGDGFVGSAVDEAYKRRNQLNVQFSSGAREVQAQVVEKPYKGFMVLYNSYGTELMRIETKDHFKTEAGALRNVIRRTRKAIKDEKEKMSIPQRSRCLFCDYNDLKDAQKEKVLNIAFIAHKNMLDQLYGGVSKIELPSGLMAYANVYLAMEDLSELEHIIDTDAVVFDNQPGTRRLPGHLINELIKLESSYELLNKVASIYQKKNFEELDLNNHTPLWSAISQKDIGLMQKLIDLGADTNKVTLVSNSYLSPLIVSAQLGNLETTKLLLANGARKELTTETGQSAWSTAMWLAKYDHAQIVWPEFSFNINSEEAKNFLIQTAYYGQTDKIREFIGNGASVLARGKTGDNMPMSVIKGINTFSIENSNNDLGTLKHKVAESEYWEIIEIIKNAGFSDPVLSSIDIKKQTLLFHAYPDGSNSVTAQHVELIKRLINIGIDPRIINVNGQNAEQKYMDARFKYLDDYFQIQLNKINQERRDAAQIAQENADRLMEEQLDEIARKKSSRLRARSQTRARRIQSLDKMDDNLSTDKVVTQTSSFVRDTSDVDQTVSYDEIEDGTTEEIRTKYTNELKEINKVAEQKKQELELQIKKLKDEATLNSKERQEYVAKLSLGMS